MFNMMDMFGKMKEVQARMKEAQQSLSTITETGEAGAGLVRVTVNGLKQVQKIELDADLIKPEEREMLQDLIVAATNKAMDNVETKAREHLRQATEGLLPNIPGLDLGGLMQ
ncbi:YbaB/EbfC family nucleoid-associated protein [Fibrisoma montanum]|uniref:Nucleoid-associated protein DYU11_16115 n=1 Tax=Fibrisoma montanum TaxID=2305895 RepID=A0A418M8X6_9BACT|nr:YbaB/EbfC family nucleoid-associated protein [Fibrisoma montanum]RIV22538.1 YbaB/EbfC family nucleoid-associated protein [Fibrisoma montanum]